MLPRSEQFPNFRFFYAFPSDQSHFPNFPHRFLLFIYTSYQTKLVAKLSMEPYSMNHFVNRILKSQNESVSKYSPIQYLHEVE